MKKLKLIKSLITIGKNMDSIKALFSSRKTIILIINAFILALGNQLGLDELAQKLIGVATGVYVLSQGLADSGAQGADQAGLGLFEKLGSRKLWLSVLATIFAILGREVGLEQVTREAIAGVLGAGVVGLGIADAGFQGNKTGGDV